MLHQHGTTFFLRKCTPEAIFWHFLTKFWALFEKVAGHTMKWVAGHTPNSPDIFFNIERVSHNNIGCQGGVKKFYCQYSDFFLPSVFWLFFSCGRTRIFFHEILAGKTACFFPFCFCLMPASFRVVFSIAYNSFKKSVKSEMLQNNFWSPRKKFKWFA